VYSIQISDSFGCIIELEAEVPKDSSIYIPNIFTPNGDGFNEEFKIRNLPSKAQLMITNRWGKEIYSSKDYQNNWTGEGTSDGVYFYKLQAGSVVRTGWIELLRGTKP
jgi:gliding motility-associated-like protein